MIPKDNVHNLMLKPEVVQAVADGRFHVWAVSTIEQGIELLTGIPAGKLHKDGTYGAGTLFRKVTDALEEMTKRAMEVNRGVAREETAPTSVSRTNSKRAKRPQEKKG
jgi:predicted ATP-dependent protease